MIINQHNEASYENKVFFLGILSYFREVFCAFYRILD